MPRRNPTVDVATEETEVKEEKNDSVQGRLANGTYVNIRKSPTVHSDALFTLPMGTPLEVLDKGNKQYVKVRYKGVDGYVDRRYITIE